MRPAYACVMNEWICPFPNWQQMEAEPSCGEGKQSTCTVVYLRGGLQCILQGLN